MHRVAQNKQCSFVRDGMDIEVVAERADTSDELLDKECAALEMQAEKKGYCSLVEVQLSWVVVDGPLVATCNPLTVALLRPILVLAMSKRLVSYTVPCQMVHIANAHADESIKALHKRTIK